MTSVDHLRLNGESLVLFDSGFASSTGNSSAADFDTAVRLAEEDGWRVEAAGPRGTTFFERVALVLSEVERRLRANPSLGPYGGNDRVMFWMTVPSVPQARAELAPIMRLTGVTGVAILATVFESPREREAWLGEGIPGVWQGILHKPSV